jgi:cytochrome c-type biogenesis protein CcmH
VIRCWAFVLAFALPAGAGAIESVAPLSDPALQARYEHLTQELRCLVCQNQTIADSNAPLAADLRREVRGMLVAGSSDEEIQRFMVERYGEWILYRPRLSAQTLLLWAAPALLILLGLGIAARVILNRTRLYREDQPDGESRA